jgi:hypothetical protein
VGALVFKIGADIAELKQSMAQAQGVVETAMAGASRAASMAKAALGAVGAGLSFGALKASIDGAVNSMDELRNMSLRTGVAVEQLSALRGVAKLSGTDMDTVAAMIGKLDKSLLEFARSGGGKSAEAFKALGISSAAAKNALEQGDVTGIITRMAQELTKNGASALSVAYAQEIMGKSAAQALPFMYELARTGELNTRVTTEQAEAAHQYNVNMAKMEAASQRWKMAMAQELLPAMTSITDAMVLAQKESGKLMSLWVGLGGAASHVFGAISGAGPAKELAEVNKQLETAQKQLAAGTMNPRGASDSFWNFLIPDVKLNDRAKAALEQNIRGLTQRRDELVAAINPPKIETPKLPAYIEPKPEGGGAPQKSPYEREIEALQRAEIQVQHLTKLGEVRQKMLQGEFGVLSAGQVAELERRAANIDRLREEAQVAKETAEAKLKMMIFADNEAEKARKVREAEDKALEELRQRYIDMADPLEKYRRQLLEIEQLYDKGKLTQAQMMEAMWKVNEAMDKAAGINEKAVEKQDDLWKNLGYTFESAFEKAVTGGNKFRDVLAGLAQDVAKIFLRRTVSEPLGNAISAYAKSIDWGGITSGIGKLFGFASGGSFEVGGSGGTDSQLVGFMATPGERVTVETPAQQRPRGGGDTYIIDARGADAAGLARLEQMIMGLNGSIERRALTAVVNARQRGMAAFA